MPWTAATIAEKNYPGAGAGETEFVLVKNLLVTLTSRNLGSSVLTLTALHSYCLSLISNCREHP